MAITAQNFSALPGGTTLGGVPAEGPGGALDPFAVGTVTFTGDGATLTAVVNFIDGTQALPFTPAGAIVAIVGGSDTVGVLKAAAGCLSSITATSLTVNYSTAIANAATSKLLIALYK